MKRLVMTLAALLFSAHLALAAEFMVPVGGGAILPIFPSDPTVTAVEFWLYHSPRTLRVAVPWRSQCVGGFRDGWTRSRYAAHGLQACVQDKPWFLLRLSPQRPGIYPLTITECTLTECATRTDWIVAY